MNIMKSKRSGRPSIITTKILECLRQAFLWGATDEEASAYAGIARSTLYNYQARSPEFLDKKRAWKLNPIMKARKTLYENLSNVKIAMWFLERKRPEEFSLRYEKRVRKVATADCIEIIFFIHTPFQVLIT